jgi:hypothetical protein
MARIGHDFHKELPGKRSSFILTLIAELLELLAGRFINSAKAFARLRVFRVGNADKPLKI